MVFLKKIFFGSVKASDFSGRLCTDIFLYTETLSFAFAFVFAFVFEFVFAIILTVLGQASSTLYPPA